MQKAVVGLFFKNTDFKIIPKAMNQWKEWVKSRKRLKENARNILNWMNHPKMLEDCSTTHFKLKRINQAVMSKQRPDDELTKESNSSSKDCLGTKSDL